MLCSSCCSLCAPSLDDSERSSASFNYIQHNHTHATASESALFINRRRHTLGLLSCASGCRVAKEEREEGEEAREQERRADSSPKHSSRKWAKIGVNTLAKCLRSCSDIRKRGSENKASREGGGKSESHRAHSVCIPLGAEERQGKEILCSTIEFPSTTRRQQLLQITSAQPVRALVADQGGKRAAESELASVWAHHKANKISASKLGQVASS